MRGICGRLGNSECFQRSGSNLYFADGFRRDQVGERIDDVGDNLVWPISAFGN
jgi:hypothetical protein